MDDDGFQVVSRKSTKNRPKQRKGTHIEAHKEQLSKDEDFENHSFDVSVVESQLNTSK